MPDPTPPAYQFLRAGRPAPDFNLTAVRSGRRVSPRDCAGRVLGLVFHGRETVQAVIDINEAVRPVYPDATDVTLASVVDLSGVPRLLRRMVSPFLEQVYDEAVRQAQATIPAEFEPADYIFLLPDWDGRVSRAFAVRNADRTAAVVVIDGDGTVAGSYQGPEPGPATLALVQGAMRR